MCTSDYITDIQAHHTCVHPCWAYTEGSYWLWEHAENLSTLPDKLHYKYGYFIQQNWVGARGL